jgi:thioredoxin 1
MSKVMDLQADEWESEVLNADGPVVVDFWHNMCGWCLKLNPVYAQLPEHFDKAKFAKVNVLESTENRRLAMGHGVMGTPTIKVFCGGRPVGEIVGFRSLDGLLKDLQEILSRRDDCLAKSTPLK